MQIAEELDCAGERIASLAMVSAVKRLVLANNKPAPGLWDSLAELANSRGGPGYLSGRNPASARAVVSFIIRSGMVWWHFARKICKKQAFGLVKVVLYRGGKYRYCMKLLFVVKEIAVFIECFVLGIRCNNGIERKVGQILIIGFALVIIFFESIQNIGIIVPHNKILSKSQTKAELLGATNADYDMQKAKLLFPARNIYIRYLIHFVRCFKAEVQIFFCFAVYKNNPPVIERNEKIWILLFLTQDTLGTA